MNYRTTLKSLSLVLITCCLSLSANASSILFAHVDNYGSYIDDGNRIAQFLTNAGHTVTTRYLDSTVYSDYANFDQVFVYDLYHLADKNTAQMGNYNGIANWYNGLTDKNLILDGRIISSDVTWTNANNMSSEEAWIQNYATQLELRGGGLMLGTDHNTFQSGINEINNLIGVNPFSGFFGAYPSSQAVVDQNSPLFIPGLDSLRSDPTQYSINDNSTTGFVATGLQSNGQILTPVAYHGATLDAWDFAAVSSTMGSTTFGTANPTPDTGSTLALLGFGLLGLVGIRRRFAK